MEQFLRLLEALPKAVSAVGSLSKLLRKPKIRGVAVALITTGVLLAAFQPWSTGISQVWAERGVVYETAIAEQRTVPLADGSLLQLNTNSRAVVSYQENERRIALTRGEARFTVAPDSSRPFVVMTPQAEIRDLGTTFNILIDRDRSVVTVLDGLVRIFATEPQTLIERVLAKLIQANTVNWRNIMDLAPGEQAEAMADGRILHVLNPRLRRVRAWTENQLVFEDDPLPVLVNEFNRYHASKIHIMDQEIVHCRFTVDLKPQERALFLSYLEKLYGVIVRRQDDGSVHLYSGGKERRSKIDACEPKRGSL
jgi:transmembrane sensor